MMPEDLPPHLQTKGEEPPNDQLLFGDLQYTQQLIEKIQEALLVVSLDCTVIIEIQRYYIDALNSGQIFKDLNSVATSDFSDDLEGIKSDLTLLISRFEALLSLANDRKQMVSWKYKKDLSKKTNSFTDDGLS